MTASIESNLPPVLSRKDFETDEEYQSYLDSEASEHEPVATTEAQKETLAEIARNTIVKISGEKIPVGLRLPKRDIQRAKSLALQQGVPYQTLISSVVHQFLDGELVKK